MSTASARRAIACPACRGQRTTDFLELGEVPVFCNVQWPTHTQARQAATGPLSLAACLDCAHVFNRAFDPARAAYAPGYENSQHGSSVFRRYAQDLVERLVVRHGIVGRTVVDIGCGRGDLLALICERGGNRGFGFDPSYAGPAKAAGGAVTVCREYFAAHHAAEIRPALVCCRHVLEHVQDPVAFLTSLRAGIEAAGDTVLYLEVPNGEQLVRSLGLWDYLYEHVSYFTSDSLRAVLDAAGFEVLELYQDFGGQFLCADVRVATQATVPNPRSPLSEEVLRNAAQAMLQRLRDWRHWAGGLPDDGLVSLWGAGSKGAMFLNLLGLSAPGKLEFVIDQNVDKHGRFVSGTGQRIAGPQALIGSGVERVVLMNGIYESEVRARLMDMGMTPELVVAWP